MKNEHDIEKQHDLVQSETLRQARETFDQRKTHDRYWFITKIDYGLFNHCHFTGGINLFVLHYS